jgi:uncharacterized protein
LYPDDLGAARIVSNLKVWWAKREMKQTPQINVAPGGREVSGRTCSGCTLCCSLLGIAELQKPMFTICKHCVIGKCCKIYEVKPQECTAFLCSYRLSHEVAEYWNPKVCGMVLHRETHGEISMMTVMCSNSAKHRWKQEPYWGDIKRMALDLHVRHGGYIRIIRKGEPVLIINPKTFETHAAGSLKGMAALSYWQQFNQAPRPSGRTDDSDVSTPS